ncbi:putative reverse transcriptase domain-containing protein [Tanacetum coccineum]|uniref:Reverse transcriptase domain-containing protein n=1 Tax=Tanacetum coccineum TaxID=301880 RepID=A0ABQ5G227_9ASTR
MPVHKLAKINVNEIVARHRVPVSIFSDRDGRFTSNFWQDFQKELGTKLHMSTAFHPQTDGQSERTIQTLEDMLRACVIDFRGNWDDHTFEVGSRELASTVVVLATTEKIETIHERLKAAQDRWKSYADNRRKPIEFNMGDFVMLKVSPWKGVFRFKNKGKLGLRFIGLFKILKRVGEVAYVLELPEEMRVNLLRRIEDNSRKKIKTTSQQSDSVGESTMEESILQILQSSVSKGLLQAVADWLPNAEHKHCARHIYANFKKRWSGLQFKRLFRVLLQHQWSQSFYRCSATFENGISESFNSRIIGARDFDNKDPITPSVRRHTEYNKKIQREVEEAPLSSMPPPTATLSISNTMPPPSTPSTSNTMPPPPTPSPSTSNTMPPPSGSSTMPSHATSASTRTNKGKCPLIPKKRGMPAKSSTFSSRGGSKGGATSRGGFRGGATSRGGSRGGASKRGRGSSKREEHRAQDKGMPEDVAARKQPMIEDEPLQVGADLPSQESTVEANLKPTRSKKSKAAEDLNRMRIFHKNIGRSKRNFNRKIKNFKFDKHGSVSTPDKAFDVE